MGIKLEQRLAKLEDEVKAIKSSYNIYGGLVRSYLNFYSVEITGSLLTPLQVKFTPDYSANDKILVFGFYYNATHNGVIEALDDGYIDVQSSNSEIMINMGGLTNGLTVNITLLTPMPGTFTRIQ